MRRFTDRLRRSTLSLGVSLLIGSGGLGIWARLSAQAQVRPGMTENQIFDATYRPPLELLQQLYEQNQVLVLSFEEHGNERQYQALTALLERVGRDPRLKYIVLERFIEDAPVLEAASATDMDEVQLEKQLLAQYPEADEMMGKTMEQYSLCNPEFAFTWGELMPRLRAINASRPAINKLRATTIDGVSAAIRAHKGLDSYERDSATAVLFNDRIWQLLRRDTTAKVIVVYNIGHTIQGFTLVQGDSAVPPTFLSIFLHQHSEARPHTALVMVEGAETESGQAFRLSQRQVARAPDRAFGIHTAPFRGVAVERGESALTSDEWAVHMGLATSARNGISRVGESIATLPDMVDAIVWLPASEQLKFKAANEYLPKVCPAGR